MLVNKNVYYIREDKWDEFLSISKDVFGFTKDKKTRYPEYIIRECENGVVRIGISKPCINVWDLEDKNGSREIWYWTGRNGRGSKNYVQPYIQDLIDSGYIE